MFMTFILGFLLTTKTWPASKALPKPVGAGSKEVFTPLGVLVPSSTHWRPGTAVGLCFQNSMDASFDLLCSHTVRSWELPDVARHGSSCPGDPDFSFSGNRASIHPLYMSTTHVLLKY